MSALQAIMGGISGYFEGAQKDNEAQMKVLQAQALAAIEHEWKVKGYDDWLAKNKELDDHKTNNRLRLGGFDEGGNWMDNDLADMERSKFERSMETGSEKGMKFSDMKDYAEMMAEEANLQLQKKREELARLQEEGDPIGPNLWRDNKYQLQINTLTEEINALEPRTRPLFYLQNGVFQQQQAGMQQGPKFNLDAVRQKADQIARGKDEAPATEDALQQPYIPPRRQTGINRTAPDTAVSGFNWDASAVSMPRPENIRGGR